MRIKPKIPLSLLDIASALKLPSSDLSDGQINAITLNSNEAEENDLFIAINGERFNGEDYLDDAKAKGAYTLSSKSAYADFKINDTREALLKIAEFYKSHLNSLKATIAITGSVGKTTTKNILAKMLTPYFKVHATEGNYNNILGVSHTILNAAQDTEILILEMGMNHSGEIDALSRATKPDYAIITNIGTSHIGNLGSREKIASAKLEILNGMANPKITVPYSEPLLEKVSGRRYTFSIEDSMADAFILPKCLSDLTAVFDIYTKDGKAENIEVELSGLHILKAIASSIPTLCELGLTLKEIACAVQRIDNDCKRGHYSRYGDITVYDDTYSSSYEAVISDFELLSLKREAVKSCMLGDMLELGEKSEELHKKIGEKAYEYGFSKIFAFGIYAPCIAEGAIKAGMPESRIFINTDTSKPDITAKQINENHTPNEIILFKASHAIKAERIYPLLKGRRKNAR